MRKFVGKVLTLIGGIGLFVLSFLIGGVMIYNLIKGYLNVLTSTVYFEGWISLLGTLTIAISNFFISLIGLKNVSINSSNKNILIGSFILLILITLNFSYVLIVIKVFEDLTLFIITFILIYIFYLIYIIGIIIDLKN